MEEQHDHRLQQALQRIAQLEQQQNVHEEIIGQQQQQNQEQQQEIQQLQQQLQEQEVESDEDDESDEDEEEEEDGDSLAMSHAMVSACQGGIQATIVRLLDAGQSVNCVDTLTPTGWTPVMYVLRFGHLHAAIMLVGRGADLSKVSNRGSNVLHCAAEGGTIDCINWVLANTSIDINSTNNNGDTPLKYIISQHSYLNVAKRLVEKGANLFMKADDGQSPMDHSLGPQLLQHAKDLIWVSVKPLLLLT
jgi:hypothetical protein